MSEQVYVSTDFEHVYSKKEVVDRDGKWWIQIKLAGKRFLLPLVNVASDDEPLAIGYLVPDPRSNLSLATASSVAMRNLFEQCNARVVVMPTSTKSEWFIGEAIKMLPGVTLIRLPGSKIESEVVAQSLEGSVLGYTPVTGTRKFIGLPRDIDALIDGKLDSRQGLIFADDVWTTGATLLAMRAVMEPYLLTQSFQTVVLAREAALDQNYPPLMAPGTKAVIALPEMTGLSADKLVPISQKDTPAGIPVAIEL